MVATPILAPSLPGWDHDDIVPETLITRLYRAGEDHALALTAALSSHQRALIAAYCYRRSHLHRLGLAIASTCDQSVLMRVLGSGLGTTVFAQSRERDRRAATAGGHRPKISLAKGAGMRPPALRLVVTDGLIEPLETEDDQ
jgi:hypothetical protein